MNTVSVLVVDDDREQAHALERMLEQYPTHKTFEVEICTSLAALDERLRRGFSPGIVFMDVVLEDSAGSAGNGITAVQKLLQQCPGVQVIYVTGHVEYCTRVYRTSHVYFLTKPLQPEDFTDALDKAIENLEERIARPFGVKVGGRIMRVLPADIEFVESDRRKVRIHLADQVIEAYESLGGISRKLPGTFVQCHKSFLVNMEKIAEMRSDQIDLLSGATIPISQKRSRPTREAFMDFLKERL